MNNRSMYGFVLFLLAVLALMSLWLQYSVQTRQLGAHSFGAHSPDYIIRNLTVTRTNLLGQKQYTLWADFAQHYPDDDSTDLSLPRMVAQDAQQGLVTVRADRAVATSKAKQVNFIGHVVVVRDQHSVRGPMTLTTTYLESFPDQQIILTSQPVDITDKRAHITATGMEMDNHKQWIDLTHNVRAHYEMAR
jgi:lipopolysaccharide export system protein LptC